MASVYDYIGRINRLIDFKVDLGNELGILNRAINSSRNLESIRNYFKIDEKNNFSNNLKRINENFEYKKNKMYEFRGQINPQIDRIGEDAGNEGYSISWSVPG